jgi:hypothetical protein
MFPLQHNFASYHNLEPDGTTRTDWKMLSFVGLSFHVELKFRVVFLQT